LISYVNRAHRLISLESYASVGTKTERISGIFTFSHEGNVGFSDFGDQSWRLSAPYDGYKVRVLCRKTDDAEDLPNRQLAEIAFAPRTLNTAKDIRVELFDTFASVSVDGQASRVPYRPKDIVFE